MRNPPGYDSSFAAIMDLLRFGPAIWSCAQFHVLLFHAERSAAYAKEADKHSENQAICGIYSVQQMRWIRGPLGLSRASWYSANTQLAIDPDNPSTTPDGVLRIHRTGKGRGQIVEYAVDWEAVKKRIGKWKECSRFESPPQKKGLEFRPLPQQEGSKNWTLKGPEFGPFPENPDVENKEPGGKEGSKNWTLQSKSDFKSDLTSPSVECTREQLDIELELASGERPRTDGPSSLILEANKKLRMPFEAIQRFLHDKATDFRERRNYKFNPQTLAKAFTEDVIAWSRKDQNRNFIASCLHQQEVKRERDRIAAVSAMQSPEAKEQQRLIDEALEAKDYDSAERLVNEVQKRLAKGASR